MEREDIPAWLERAVERKEDHAEAMAAKVSDAPDDVQARLIRSRGRAAELDRTLDRQRELQAARTPDRDDPE